jgi:hypothetical protein
VTALTLVAAAEPPAELHAPDCAGNCPRWLAVDAPTCLPYPCRCADTKENAPQWRKDYGDVKCWWRRRTGGVASRCPCWGGDCDGKPGDCCSHHSANPRYLLEGEFTVIDPDEQLSAAAEVAELFDGRPPDADEVVWEDRMAWEDERPQRKPYVRRWQPHELACEHDVSQVKGVHCPDCHENYATEMSFGMHRASWMAPCRAPQDIRDVDTGAELLQLNQHGAWAIDWSANAT